MMYLGAFRRRHDEVFFGPGIHFCGFDERPNHPLLYLRGGSSVCFVDSCPLKERSLRHSRGRRAVVCAASGFTSG